MSRYIDANDFENVMYHEAFETDTEMQRWDSGCWIRYKLFENLLEKQPTADVVEVVHGEWIPIDVGDCCYRCSVCDFVRDAYLLEEDNYCPHCGARMDGGR